MISSLVLRARNWSLNTARGREFLVAAALVLVAWVAGREIPSNYGILAGVLVVAGGAFLMLRNPLACFVFVLFVSTVHHSIKAVVFNWSPKSVIFKEGLLLMLFSFCAFEFVSREQQLNRTRLLGPLAILTAIATIQCFNPNTYGIFTILDDYRFWAAPLLIYLLATHLLRTQRQAELVLAAVFGYAVIEALYGCVQTQLPLDVLVRLGAKADDYFYYYMGTARAFAAMGAPPLAAFTGMLLPISFFHMSQARTKLAWGFFILTAVIFVTCNVLTLVRVSWIAMAVSVAFYAVMTRRLWILGYPVAAGLLLVTFATGYTRAKVEGLQNLDRDISFQTRLTKHLYFKDAVAFRVFGYGMGTFSQNRIGIHHIYYEKTGYGRATENFYLTVVLEMGWFGAAAYGWIMYKIYQLGLRNWRTLRTRRYRELSIALLAGLLSLDVAKFGGPAGYYPPEGWHYWLFVALLVLLPQFDRELAERTEARAEASGVSP